MAMNDGNTGNEAQASSELKTNKNSTARNNSVL